MKADAREIVWAMVEGGSVPDEADGIPTVILLGHLDVAGVQDYSSDLDPFDPQGLLERLMEVCRAAPRADDERLMDAASGDWMFGRGSFDMKSGVAAQIAVMGALEREKDSLPGNVLMITTPDEEVESAGLMDALSPLIDLRNDRNLRLLGVINSDYTAPRSPGDETRTIYRGTIGKLLCCFYVRGCETHVGEAFRGLDANLIGANLVRATNLNADLCDEVDGEITVPPVTQKVRDLKARYDAQTPVSAVIHCSRLVHGWTPGVVLDQMVELARDALNEAVRARDVAWDAYSARQRSAESLDALEGCVLTYQDLYETVAERTGAPTLRKELKSRAIEVIKRTREAFQSFASPEREFLVDRAHVADLDSRERSLVIVRELVDIAIREGALDNRHPAIVVYFAPPFFPPVRGVPDSPLSRAIAAEVGSGCYGPIAIRGFYPYVSEMSFMRVDRSVQESLPVLTANFPLWRDDAVSSPDDRWMDSFHVPFDVICDLNCDVANIGPWGKEAHGQGERVHKPYSFETVPELIHNVVLRLLNDGGR